MKTRSRYIFNIFTLLTLLVMTFTLPGIQPVSATQSTVPAIIHIKFRETAQDGKLLPTDIQSSVSSIERLFGLPQERLLKMKSDGESRLMVDRAGIQQAGLPDLNLWFKVTLKPASDVNSFLNAVKRLNNVQIAEAAPVPPPPPDITPNFTSNQGYLVSATNGIDANYAWTIAGGNGAGITIYDVEYGWTTTHEDLSKAAVAPILMNPSDSINNPYGPAHGTAVLGEMVSDNNSKGVTGISWGADLGLAPAYTYNAGYNPANAILLAVAHGEAGDVILIEQQYWACGGDYGPLEIISSVYDAILTASANGFVVVEAAGNGSVNLDSAACENKFDRNVRDSGAIIVGAGDSPSSGSDRQRLYFSTYGSRVDLQGWGTDVMTTGYGDYYKNPSAAADENYWYTSDFGGTSGASPIVAGAAANLQGIAKQRSGTPLSPNQVRSLLVETGSPQLGNTAEHIGPRPNLRQAIDQLLTGYSISGNAGVAGATLSYTDGTPKTTIADGAGLYSFKVSYNWTGAVTPTKACYIFTPASKTYAKVLADQTNQNYSATDIAPCVLSSVRTDPNPTSAASDNFTVSFSETVTGVDVTDFTLTTTGVSGAAVSGISGSGSVYTVTVNTGSGNGTIRLNLVDNNSIIDTASHPLGGAGAGNGNFTSGEVYTIIKSATFTDVPLSYWSSTSIERLYNAGITGGCTTAPLSYCPAKPVTRAQMAIFLLRGMHGSMYTPPAATGTKFTDVPLGSFGAAWIEQLATEGITSGCGGGNYCPNTTVSRAQMAIFLVRARHGSTFIPPTATGIFLDVPIGSFGANYIEQLVTDAITSGCGSGNYCPNTTVKRDSMAVFLVKTFNLP